MTGFFRKPYRWAVVYTVVLVLFTLTVMLDAFVIPKIVDGSIFGPLFNFTDINILTDEKPVITENSYKDSNISIEITKIRRYDTTCYVADISLSGIQYLKTAFAKDQYGKNIREYTSSMAKRVGAIFAVNGDYYGFRDSGFVIRNGTLYRTEPRTGKSRMGLAINYDGTFKTYDEINEDAETLYRDGAYQVFTFGPVLVKDGKVAVSTSSEVDAAKSSNQRTGIGIIDPLHYIIIVSDGRIEGEAGLSIHQLGDVFAELGCKTAYNLDGGGSTTMWFNGKVINVPTFDGDTIAERKVSDCVYIGY